MKSVSLDTWLPEQVQSMRVMGNAKAKAVYEAELPDAFRRPQSDQSLELFIRAKYDQKRYILKGWVPPKVDINDLPSLSEPLNSAKAAPAGKKFVPISQVQAPAPAKKEDSLVDLFSVPDVSFTKWSSVVQAGSAPKPAQAAPSNDLFSLGSAAPAARTESGDLDDFFGPIVSAPTASVPTPSQPTQQDASLSDGLASLNFGPPAPQQSELTLG